MKFSFKNPFSRSPKSYDSRLQRVGSARAYAGAQVGRLTADWITSSTSQDSEALASLKILRNRSRDFSRNNNTAKNALRVIRNNVVGTGVGFQPSVKMQRGDKLDEKTNSTIKTKWNKWGKADSCDVAGKLDFPDIERMIMNVIPQDGEILIRKRKKAVGKSKIPFSLELLEADYLLDHKSARAPNGNEIRMGVEVDQFKRPVAYWLYPNHPGDYQFASFQPSKYIRVPAEEMIHLFIPERLHQTRGIPWGHSGMISLRHLAGYQEAEVIAARTTACIMGFIETPDGEYQDITDPNAPDQTKDNQRNLDLEPGVSKVLAQGEKFNGFAPQRPGGQYEPFVRANIREYGAGIGCSYESLSKDYSQSNFSSSRLALLDDRDQWKVLQKWLISHFHQIVYEEWLEAAVSSGEISLPSFYSNMDFFTVCAWKPRGWDWVDPVKDVTAHIEACRAGFETQEFVCASRGDDLEDVIAQRKREKEMAEEAGLTFESDGAVPRGKGSVPSPTDSGNGEGNDSNSGDSSTVTMGNNSDKPNGATQDGDSEQ